jgi:hypothetical protein
MTAPIELDRAKAEKLLHDLNVDWPTFLIELEASDIASRNSACLGSGKV